MVIKKEEIYNPFTDKFVNINPYGRRAKDIYRYFIEEVEVPPENILPPLLTYNNGRFRKLKPVIDYTNVRRLTYQQVDAVNDDTQINFVKEVFKSYAGQTVEVVKKYTLTNESGDAEVVEDNVIETIPEVKKGFAKWWKSFSVFLWVDSESWIFSEEYNNWEETNLQAQLLILSLDKVGKNDYQQYFLDGTSHCVFTPIKDWAENCKEDAKSKSAIKRYSSMINKIDKYLIKYSKGVPESDFPEICNNLQIGIEIDIPSSLIRKDNEGHTKYIEVVSQRKPLRKFKFINTRLNHIEVNNIKSKDNFIEVSQEELEEIRDKESFSLWKECKDGLVQVNTLDAIYKLADAEEGYGKELKDFQDANNLRDFQIEYFQNKDLSNWLIDSVARNQCVMFAKLPEELSGYEGKSTYYDLMNSDDFEEDYEYLHQRLKDLKDPNTNITKDYIKRYIPITENDIKVADYIKGLQKCNHIDLRKAYTRGSDCIKYQGYLGKITDFRKTDKIMGLGIYQIYDIKYENPLLKKLGVLHEGNSYTSPELEYYKDLGVDFKISMGCWGTKTDIDFGSDWNSGMFQKDDKGLSHYCKWYGCLMRCNKVDRYNFYCKDIRDAGLNAWDEECDIRYSDYFNTGIIEYKKKRAYHSSHIASFIHSYCRITMIEQLLKIPMDNIVAIQVDGIFYKGDIVVDKLFESKEGKSLKYIAGYDTYVEDDMNTIEDYPDLPENRVDNIIEVHTGAGGCGKTHNNLTDKGLINPLFIAPSWKLARNKKSEYGIDSSVFYYLLSDDPDAWRPISRYYNTLIIDEISMLSNEGKKIIMKRFNQHKIIFCGDIGFQLPPIEGTEFKVKKLPKFHHTTNYRCKCEKLHSILLQCRDMIQNHSDKVPIEKYCTKVLGLNIIDKDSIDYTPEDLIITKTHKNKDYYTQKYKDIKKFVVLENTRDFSNGEIIIGEKPKKVRCELRHAFTIHSIQGETAKNKLFIDTNRMNSMRMLYTALSRAKYLDQIVLIK